MVGRGGAKAWGRGGKGLAAALLLSCAFGALASSRESVAEPAAELPMSAPPAATWAPAEPLEPTTPAAPVALTRTAATLHAWVLASHDHTQRPFVIVDKKAARVFVFDTQGRLLGAANTLLGQAFGDHSVPGVGDGDVNLIPVADRTTPAGRFESEPGRNLSGEAIVWVDYQAALAIHRVRPGRAYAARLRALASATPADNRASLGCVVVAPEFFDAVIAPTLGRARGVVYVLPETRTLAEVFGNRLAAQR
jgi:hypothetical protein